MPYILCPCLLVSAPYGSVHVSLCPRLFWCHIVSSSHLLCPHRVHCVQVTYNVFWSYILCPLPKYCAHVLGTKSSSYYVHIIFCLSLNLSTPLILRPCLINHCVHLFLCPCAIRIRIRRMRFTTQWWAAFRVKSFKAVVVSVLYTVSTSCIRCPPRTHLSHAGVPVAYHRHLA